MITKQMILALNASHPSPQAAADALQQAAVKFGITDPRSIAAWLANLMVESRLIPQREDMYYRDPATLCRVWPSKFPALYNPNQYVRSPEKLGNLVYSNREGNGSVASGDGYRFRGAGFIQRTFRNGFALAQKRTGLPFLTQPELFEQYGPAAMDAAAYWTIDSNADRLARAGDIRGTRRAVNGAKMLDVEAMLRHYACVLPLVQAAPQQAGGVILIDSSGKEIRWDGQPTKYAGTLLDAALISQLRVLYPQPGGPWMYSPGMNVFLRRNGDLVLERAGNIPS